MGELLLPDREAHYSKMLVVYQRLQQFIQAVGNPQYHVPEWILFIDCDVSSPTLTSQSRTSSTRMDRRLPSSWSRKTLAGSTLASSSLGGRSGPWSISPELR